MRDELIGKKVRVRFDNTPDDYIYTISEILEDTESLFLIKDKYGVLKGINKKYIKEIY